MLSVPDKAPGALFSFVQQWLETEDFTDKPKDAETFPIFNPEVAEDLEQETRTFVKEALLDPAGGSLKQLLTATLRLRERPHRQAVRRAGAGRDRPGRRSSWTRPSGGAC